MSNMHLVTGYAGSPHVTAEDHASMFVAAIRSGQFVLDAGNRFAVTVIDNNNIRISDGELMMQGRHVKIDPGKTVNLTVESGVLGQQRVDYIVARYTRNTDDGIEECNLVVLKGAPATSNPAAPECFSGDINADKALVNDFPLYRVEINGLTLGTPTALFSVQASLADELHRFCIESTDAPGCYYRISDRYTEWLNPPMIPGVKYLTTERWGGEPVFTERIELHIAAGGSGPFSLMSATEVISAELRYFDNGVWLDVCNNPNITVESTRINLRPGLKVSSVDEVDIVGVFRYIGVSQILPPL